MRLENSFEVPAPPEAAWDVLNDVPGIVPCMPGAALDEVVDENTFKVTMHVKLGPIALQFATTIERTEVDTAARQTTLTANAREIKGRGRANATIVSSLEPAGTGSRVTIVTELQLQGLVASTGRGIIGDVADQLTTKFAECIAKRLGEGAATPAEPAAEAPAPDVKPIGGLTLLFRAIFRPVFRRAG